MTDQEKSISNRVTVRMLWALLGSLAIVIPLLFLISGRDGRDGRDGKDASAEKVAQILSESESFVQKVKPKVGSLPSPDWTSAWFLMKSQAGPNSFKQVEHPIGALPSIVQVQVKAQGGANDGYVFPGVGSSQNDDDSEYSNYGGVVFAYNKNNVRLWAPDKNNGKGEGAIISVHEGWGGEQKTQYTHDALVRILIWK